MKPNETQIAEGLERYGDPFRALLRLPDADQHGTQILQKFQDCYVGSFATMAELLDKLTEVRRGMEAVAKTAEDWGLEGCVGLDRPALMRAARETWDIVELGDSLYVFMK